MFIFEKVKQEKNKDEIQRKASSESIKSSNLTGMPNMMKSHSEQNSGLSFDDVRVRYNSNKPAIFKSLVYTHHPIMGKAQEMNNNKAQKCNVVQMEGEREATRHTMIKKEGDIDNTTYGIRRGNRKWSIDHSMDDGKDSKQKLTFLRNAMRERFQDNDEKKLIFLKGRASLIMGSGNCAEFAAIAFSHLVSNTTNQWVYYCSMLSDDKRYNHNRYDHKFVIVSQEEYNIGLFPVKDNYNGITVIDPWNQYIICTLEQFCKKEHPYSKEILEDKRIKNIELKPDINVNIDCKMKADPTNQVVSPQELAEVDEYIKNKWFNEKGNIAKKIPFKMPSGEAFSFDENIPWERKIKDLRPPKEQLNDLDEENIDIVLDLLQVGETSLVIDKLMKADHKLFMAIIHNMIDCKREQKITVDIMDYLPFYKLDKVDEADVRDILSLSSNIGRCTEYLAYLYGWSFWSNNKKRLSNILDKSYWMLQRVVDSLPSRGCCYLTKAKAKSMCNITCNENLSSMGNVKISENLHVSGYTQDLEENKNVL